MRDERTVEDLVRWAADEAAARLAPLGDRWRHVLGVVDQARSVAPILSNTEQQCLLAAAYLHDIGWAPELVRTRFHPIDGACWLRDQGLERLACLVAHHSAARFEADLRGLGPALAGFELEKSPTSDALTYCDLTTSPVGEPTTPQARWADITERYGAHDVVVQALVQARPSLEGAVSRTPDRLRGAGP